MFDWDSFITEPGDCIYGIAREMGITPEQNPSELATFITRFKAVNGYPNNTQLFITTAKDCPSGALGYPDVNNPWLKPGARVYFPDEYWWSGNEPNGPLMQAINGVQTPVTPTATATATATATCTATVTPFPTMTPTSTVGNCSLRGLRDFTFRSHVFVVNASLYAGVGGGLSGIIVYDSHEQKWGVISEGEVGVGGEFPFASTIGLPPATVGYLRTEASLEEFSGYSLTVGGGIILTGLGSISLDGNCNITRGGGFGGTVGGNLSIAQSRDTFITNDLDVALGVLGLDNTQVETIIRETIRYKPNIENRRWIDDISIQLFYFYCSNTIAKSSRTVSLSKTPT